MQHILPRIRPFSSWYIAAHCSHGFTFVDLWSNNFQFWKSLSSTSFNNCVNIFERIFWLVSFMFQQRELRAHVNISSSHFHFDPYRTLNCRSKDSIFPANISIFSSKACQPNQNQPKPLRYNEIIKSCRNHLIQ